MKSYQLYHVKNRFALELSDDNPADFADELTVVEEMGWRHQVLHNKIIITEAFQDKRRYLDMGGFLLAMHFVSESELAQLDARLAEVKSDEKITCDDISIADNAHGKIPGNVKLSLRSLAVQKFETIIEYRFDGVYPAKKAMYYKIGEEAVYADVVGKQRNITLAGSKVALLAAVERWHQAGLFASAEDYLAVQKTISTYSSAWLDKVAAKAEIGSQDSAPLQESEDNHGGDVEPQVSETESSNWRDLVVMANVLKSVAEFERQGKLPLQDPDIPIERRGWRNNEPVHVTPEPLKTPPREDPHEYPSDGKWAQLYTEGGLPNGRKARNME